jgi:predicted alpha/beta superfamily hydrolase
MKLIKKSIYLDSLSRDANLYVLLPSDYESSNQHYPVIYFHDGQNLFLKEDSYLGETWGVEEALRMPSMPRVIVVALSSAVKGNNRLQEYNVFDSTFPSHPTWHIKGKGNLYLEYLFHSLKPMIDQTYRTRPNKEDTYMIGSSMGGVISLEAALLYPHILGHVAGLSNAFYSSLEKIEKLIKAKGLSLSSLYLDTGDSEIGLEQKHSYLDANHRIAQVIKAQHPNLNFKYDVIVGGEHNEKHWKKRLPEIIRFLFGI